MRLALLLVLPGLLISTLLTWRIFVTTRQDTETGLLETARGLTQLVDREFIQGEVLLHTLAATDELRTGQLPAFDRLARATAVIGGTIVLVDATGQELIDTALPPGVMLPREKAPTGWAAESVGEPVISPLTRMASGMLAVQVILPVSGQQGARPASHMYDLKLIVPTASLQAIVMRSALPSGWMAAVTDATGVLVARTRKPEHYIGRRAGPGLLAFLARDGEEVRNSISVDEVPVVVAFVKSPLTHYVVAVNVARATMAQAGEQSSWLLLGLGSAAILIGLLGAVVVARGITRPIEAMADAARRLGESGAWVSQKPGRGQDWSLAETEAVATALAGAARALVERQEALTELNASLAARVAARTCELAAANAALDAERLRLGSILDQMPIGVVVHQADGTLLFVNIEARRLLELPNGPLDAVPWPRFRDGQTILSPQERPSARALRGLTADRMLLTLEPAAMTKKLELEVNASPVRDAQGQVSLSVKTLQDVTARLEAEEARRRSQRLEAIGQLTGGVAHEFNNVLMAVSGCLDLLAPYVAAIPPEGGRPRAAALLANASRAASRGGRLTGQLLAFARRQYLQVEPVDLNSLVTGMKELLESTLGRAIEVQVLPDPAVWPAMADPSQLELVLLNLAINARDAMPGGGRLTIRTANACLPPPFRPEDPPEGEHAVLFVGDTGDGMSASVLARAFEPFFTTKDVGRGSGLGLPQVLGVAQQMGGGVAISSVPDEGTEVRVFLPRALQAPAEVPRPPAVEAPPGLLRGARLLLVDDDADVREIARVMLEELGAVVVEAESGAAALLHLQTERFELVLADYTMPKMTGMDLAEEIARIMPGLPVLLMTGYGSIAVSDPGPHIRATLLKPFRTEALSQVLMRELGLGEAGGGQAGKDAPVPAGG